ncbi:hypothetical protein H2200_001665 [Cladophialophora chaetospira]|uniref:Uncharacterized protein n=1 Tax=Cladophialophora chaetospira TaxID=386627 RepID=A0AA38XM49_9EURO|nr:hypothetical protein H2200_001665 [Cladophialophora chaetospira]
MSELTDQFTESLKIKKFDQHECLSALRGEAVPKALGFESTQLCVVRGILHYPGFGSALHNVTPRITRALNARSIMSDIIPDMTAQEDFPYCIWYPQTAREDTYRELVERYPNMKYQVARACGVAGYTDLYQELNVLPDVHVAEESRDNGQMELFEIIMKSPVLYSVMNDYERTVTERDPPSHCQLNGDTAVRSWLLNSRQKYEEPLLDDMWDEEEYYDRYKELYFNITEDQCIDEHGSEELPAPSELLSLLYSPLPRHLPNVNKDLLICLAAYNGDIDRYARLRRPKMQWGKEAHCVLRGIYHNTMFARWWLTQLELEEVPATHQRIMRAVMARFIMTNDLSRINDRTPAWYLPYTIYYPCLADSDTYKELARRKSAMKEQVARACIIANYRSVFDALDVEPTDFLLREARDSPYGYYLETLQHKMQERGLALTPRYGWKCHTYKDMREKATIFLQREIYLSDIDTQRDWIYEGRDADVSKIELFVVMTDDFKKVVMSDDSYEGELGDITRLYEMDDIPTALAKARAQAERLHLGEGNDDVEQADSNSSATGEAEGEEAVRET